MSKKTVRALDGVRVLDFSRILAGPLCTVQLADLGAEIIKVEHPVTGDDTRGMLPMVGGESHFYLSANRNKKSVALDISTEEGRAIVHELAATCDVLIENFRNGVMEKHGFGYEVMKEKYPRLIYCSISAYGSTGPMAQRAGFDPVLQAESGMMSVTGEADGDPMRHPLSIIDTYTSLYAAQAIMAALMVRDRTGHGEFIDLALIDCAYAVLTNVGTNYLTTGEDPVRRGNMHPTSVPNGLFHTKTVPLYIAVGNERLWGKFCDGVLARPDLKDDTRFSGRAERVANRDALADLLSEIFLTDTCEAWLEKMHAQGVPGGAVRPLSQALEAPEVAEREMVVPIEHPTIDNLRLIASPIKFSEGRTADPVAPPLLGQHTDEVLSEMLGKSAEEITRLRTAGVIR